MFYFYKINCYLFIYLNISVYDMLGVVVGVGGICVSRIDISFRL